MALADKVRTPISSRGGPVWAGPESSADNGGISFSLLSRFLVCKERFKLQVYNGIIPKRRFEPKMDFGSMWHACEEAWANSNGPEVSHSEWATWVVALDTYTEQLYHKFPFDREAITHWHDLCLEEFPRYIEYWEHHPEEMTREVLFSEQVFHQALVLPSGRIVYLKGKWDRLDMELDVLPSGHKPLQLWLGENKTKSSIDVSKIQRQLSFDLQTMLYIVALTQKQDSDFWNRANKRWRNLPVAGVRYNVVRRSAHKSVDSMIKKCEEDIRNGRGGEWFSRWTTEVSTLDIQTFLKTCLYPVLENLCNWWDVVCGKPWTQLHQDAAVANVHWRHPFGVYNVLDEGGSTDVDSYLATGSMVGLERTTELFPELCV